MMLYKLLSGWDRSAYHTEVISLTDVGAVGERIGKLKIPVRALEMRRGRPGVSGLIRLAKWLRQSGPDVVQTWMYHADLVGGLAARISVSAPVIWGIRNGVLEPHGNKRSTIWTAKLCARLSGVVPRRIISNSEKARRFHESLGYRRDKLVVIPNGFDVSVFRPDSAARDSLRSELGLPAETLLIGLVARFDPQKDHRNFVEAARLLQGRVPEVHFVLCGEGIDRDNAELAAWIYAAGRPERFHLLGRRDDIPRVTAALDVAACASYAEAFPNVLGEAMACGVPCAATEAGDSALIIGDTGSVVPTKSPRSLAEAWSKLLDMGAAGRRKLGEKARQRIQENFNLTAICAQYEALYREVARAHSE